MHLAMISSALSPDVHAVLVVDGAGWHSSTDLVVPENLSLLRLPPYAPELNPIERLRLWLKEHKLSNRVFHDLNAILIAGVDAWKALTDDLVRSICRVSWLANAMSQPTSRPPSA